MVGKWRWTNAFDSNVNISEILVEPCVLIHILFLQDLEKLYPNSDNRMSIKNAVLVESKNYPSS